MFANITPFYLHGRECISVIGKPLICMLTCEQCRRARDYRRDTRERSFQKERNGQVDYSYHTAAAAVTFD